MAGLNFHPELIHLAAIAAIILFLFVLSHRYGSYSDNNLFGIAVMCGFFLMGIVLISQEKSRLSDLPPEESVFICTVSDYPEEKPNSFLLTIRLNKKISDKGAEPLKGSIQLYHSKTQLCQNMVPGDLMVIRCRPEPISNRGNPYEFDFRFYMENNGIKYNAFTDDEDIIEFNSSSRRNIIHRSLIVRKRIIEMFRERGITENRLPLVSALVLGEKRMLDREQKDNFIRAGIMHIMAVSGLHAVIISLFVLSILYFLKRRFNFLRISTAVLVLWGFAFITGLTPSVLRATIMFTFVQAGILLNRKVNPVNSVLASAFVLIIIRPSVIFDAGFLLSYSAVIFIILFYKRIYDLLKPGGRIMEWIWQSAVITIVAQAGTLALTIMLFNRFPVWFIITNIIIVPLSSLAIILGCLVPLFYPLKILSESAGFLLDKLTGLTEFLTRTAANLPFAGITGIGMTTSECILLMAVIFSVLYYISYTRKKSIFTVLIVIFTWAAATTVISTRTRSTGELIAYNVTGNDMIGFRTGRILNVYSDNPVPSQVVERHIAAAKLRAQYHSIGDSSCMWKAGGKKIAFLRTVDINQINQIRPDIIVVRYFDTTLNDLSYPPGQIVVLNGNDRWRTKKFNISNIHYIRTSGAFSCQL